MTVLEKPAANKYAKKGATTATRDDPLDMLFISKKFLCSYKLPLLLVLLLHIYFAAKLDAVAR